MVTHTLNCSVCGGEFHSKQNWNDHLLNPSHQKLVWRECVSSWWMDTSLRCCCLVVFTSCPVTHSFAREIVDYFGNKLSRRFLTDFVYIEGSRFVALQFESKIIVETVLKKNPDQSGIIGGNVIQMKKLSDLLELEWQHLNQNYLSLIETPPEVSKCHPKLNDFHWIRNCTEVSVENWENFQKLMSHVKVAFNLPELFVFGNYAQRIFFFGTRDPRFFICNCKKLFTPHTLQIRKSQSHLKLRQFKIEGKYLPAIWFFWRQGKHRFRFTLVDDFSCIMEVQMFRLLDYLCQFDSRLNGVLRLVAFWILFFCYSVLAISVLIAPFMEEPRKTWRRPFQLNLPNKRPRSLASGRKAQKRVPSIRQHGWKALSSLLGIFSSFTPQTLKVTVGF